MNVDDIDRGATSAREAKLFRDLARKWTPLSDEIKAVRYRFGEASDGSPAIWITLVAPADLSLSKEIINAINRAAETVRKDVFAADTDRWPYIKVETE